MIIIIQIQIFHAIIHPLNKLSSLFKIRAVSFSQMKRQVIISYFFDDLFFNFIVYRHAKNETDKKICVFDRNLNQNISKKHWKHYVYLSKNICETSNTELLYKDIFKFLISSQFFFYISFQIPKTQSEEIKIIPMNHMTIILNNIFQVMDHNFPCRKR